MNHSLDFVNSPGSRGRLVHWCGGVSLALLQVTLAASAAAAAPTFQALVDPPSAEHHVGKFIFAELVTPDLASSKRFYGGLFGWTFRDLEIDGSPHAEASLDGRPVAGFAQREIRAGVKRQPAWLSFIAVGDVETTRKTALLNGAKLLSPPHGWPDRGQVAVFADPQGAVFGVLASTAGDPPDLLAAPGEWIWRSLLTADPDTDAAFYQKVFDYEVFELPTERNRQHLIMATDDYARASANTAPQLGAASHPHWLNYVRVDDAASSAARALALGGKILVQPVMDRQGGKVAVVADPQGAPIGLLEWPENVPQGATP